MDMIDRAMAKKKKAAPDGARRLAQLKRPPLPTARAAPAEPVAEPEIVSPAAAAPEPAPAEKPAMFDSPVAAEEPAAPPRPRRDSIVDAEGRSRGPRVIAEPRDPDSAHARSDDFDLDFARLRRMGFISPNSRRSRVSEEFRLIKRRLMKRMTLEQNANRRKRATRSRGREHVILVTSSRPNEGKSFVAINLALSIILDEGLNVLLVDADALRPSISRIFGLPRALPGLTDILRDEHLTGAHNLLRENSLPMTYLPAGRPVESATDLFGGDRMKSFVADIAERYTDRIIIFDAPPLLASTEPVVLAQHVGQIVMVVDAEETSRSALESALDLLGTDENVNFVLNKTAVQNRSEQFGSYYDSYAQDE